MKRQNLIDFKTEEETIYFKKTDVLGIKGLVCNLKGISRNTLPMLHRTKFYFIEFTGDSKAKIYTTKAIGRNPELVRNLDMFITTHEISQVDKSENGIFEVDKSEVTIANSYVYKYDFANYIDDLYKHNYNQHERIISKAVTKGKRSKKERKNDPVWHRGSVIIDRAVRHFLFTQSYVEEDIHDGYKYYVLTRPKFEYPTHLVIDEPSHSSHCIGTVIFADPIMTDYFGICHLDWKSDFETEARAYPYNLVDSWVSRNKIKNRGTDEILRCIKKTKKKLGDKSDLDALFAVTVKNTLNRGFVGFIGKEMKFVYIDNYGRCFNKDGIVRGESVMVFLINRDGSMQSTIVKEDLDDTRYTLSMDFAKNRFPNR